MTVDDLRRAMDVLDRRFATHEIGFATWFAAYAPLSEAYRVRTGREYVSGRVLVEPVRTTVHHNRARSHGRVR